MSDKIRPQHLGRKAMLYVRQSSAYQVNHNADATRPYTGLSLGGLSRNNSPSGAIRSRVRIACKQFLTIRIELLVGTPNRYGAGGGRKSCSMKQIECTRYRAESWTSGRDQTLIATD
jgi:hypothetical protein